VFWHPDLGTFWSLRDDLSDLGDRYRKIAEDILEVRRMANVYEGKPDERQSDDVKMETSRFRPRYRALTEPEKALHDALKAKAEELEALFDKVKPGRYHSLALTSLEESVMWIVKELTS
jgi:hypothetical protein